jgi:hypothetical protein
VNNIESGVSCSQRQSQVPRTLHQTCFGLRALQDRDGDRARRATSSISSFRGGPKGHADLFHLLVPGGRWVTVIVRPVRVASAASSVFHCRVR